MKEYIFTICDIASGVNIPYKVKAANINEAKEYFKEKMIPLLRDAFSWEDMVRLFTDTDVVIDYIECDQIIEL